MASVYQGKYTFPVASTAERSMQQGAAAQAQMYAGLGKTFGDAIGTYFEAQDEKKAAESMAENRFALDVIYQGRDVPADREQRIKDARGVIKRSGGFKNFLGRIETERSNQRADRAETLAAENQRLLMESHALNRQLGGLRIGALEDAATTREAGKQFGQFLMSGEPGAGAPLTPRGEELTEALARFDPRQVPGTPEFEEAEMPRADVIASAMTRELGGERKLASDMTSAELARYVAKSDLSAEAKMAGLKRVETLKAQEMAALKFNVELGNLGLAGHKSREELTQLFRKPVNELRDDFTKEKPVQELDVVKVSFDKVRQSAATATPAGDVQLIFSFMKVLDPGSIVRESEFEQAGNTGGLPVRIQNWYDKLVKGTGLQQDQRDELVTQAKIAANAQLKATGGKIEFYKNLAKTRGIKIEQVIPQDTLDLFEKGFPGTVEAAGTPASGGSAKVGKFNVTRGGQPTAAAPVTPGTQVAAQDSDWRERWSKMSEEERAEARERMTEALEQRMRDARGTVRRDPLGVAYPIQPAAQGKKFGSTMAIAVKNLVQRDLDLPPEKRWGWQGMVEYFEDPTAGQGRREEWASDYGSYDLEVIKKLWDEMSDPRKDTDKLIGEVDALLKSLETE